MKVGNVCYLCVTIDTGNRVHQGSADNAEYIIGITSLLTDSDSLILDLNNLKTATFYQ